jgi:hypothetical protein
VSATPLTAARTPPRAPLHVAVERLERAGFTVALGGSGLLAALGLGTEVRDWDLTVDVPARVLWQHVDDWQPVYAGSSGIHADEKLMFPDRALEFICNFAFTTPAGLVRIPTIVSARVDGVPLGSPEAWAVAYALLERPEKSQALLAHLTVTGADPGTLQALFRSPLPPDIALALATLPQRPAAR